MKELSWEKIINQTSGFFKWNSQFGIWNGCIVISAACLSVRLYLCLTNFGHLVQPWVDISIWYTSSDQLNMFVLYFDKWYLLLLLLLFSIFLLNVYVNRVSNTLKLKRWISQFYVKTNNSYFKMAKQIGLKLCLMFGFLTDLYRY